MAFIKKARAGIVHPNWGTENWGRLIESHRAQYRATGYNGLARTASGSPNLINQASEILGEQFDPKNYLLTHATIVASVDVEDVPGVKMGNIQELGKDVHRKWADYRVLPNCDIYINNNHDAWSRDVLLKSYRTFVGAHNFVEHVQIEEQSKGRIIDAAARDIGDSIYTDILIATNLKHASLIEDIKAGRMGTMSMGCSVTDTICTKCGNVAADETQMCAHIKYAKGNYEFDAQGRKYRIAELCGHRDLDPTGGVHFIEASWVATPAFAGAVMRNILEPESVNITTQNQIRQVLASPPAEWMKPEDGQISKAARLSFDFGEDEGGGEEEEEKKDEGAPDPMEALETELEDYVLNNVKKRIKEKLQRDVQEDAASDGELATSTGDNIIHQGSKRSKRASEYRTSIATLVKVARSDVELLDSLARLNDHLGIKVSRETYVATLRVGSTARHDSLGSYLSACGKVLGRKPTPGEAKTLVRLGQILSLRK
jgi:hypothetical protein